MKFIPIDPFRNRPHVSLPRALCTSYERRPGDARPEELAFLKPFTLLSFTNCLPTIPLALFLRDGVSGQDVFCGIFPLKPAPH